MKLDAGFVGGATGCLDLLLIVRGTSGFAWIGLWPMSFLSSWFGGRRVARELACYLSHGR